MEYNKEVLEAIDLVNSYGGMRSASYFMHDGYAYAEQFRLMKAVDLLRSVKYTEVLNKPQTED